MDHAQCRQLCGRAAPDRSADQVSLDLHELIVPCRPAIDEEMADLCRASVDRVDDVGDLMRDAVERGPRDCSPRGTKGEVCQDAHGQLVPPRSAEPVEAWDQAHTLAVGALCKDGKLVNRDPKHAGYPTQGRTRRP